MSILIWLAAPQAVSAASGNAEVTQFTTEALNALTILGSLVATFFLVKGGYLYITSNGKPEALENAKKTIRNAVIGLVLILSANTIVSILSGALTTPSISSSSTSLNLTPIEPIAPSGGLTQVIVDTMVSIFQNIILTATKPITDAIIGFLTTTPQLATNSVVFNFWLIIVGITDSLFALLVAILGFQFMSASTFGFEELELRQLLPRIGIAFLAANTSIFVIDWVVQLSNILITAILHATGGLTQAWITNAFNPATLSVDQIALITLIFMLLFVILAVVLLLFYITRLIVIAVGAVLSPLLCLLWALPKFSDFAEISAKTYFVAIFSIFVHVVIIQLAASFLTLPGQSGTNPILSILVGIGLLLTLLKTQSFMVQLMFYNSGRTLMKKIGGQIMNVVSSKQTETKVAASATQDGIKTARKVVHA